ncbi:hypothetical protein [uncultured Tateyamaria sp.]|uniref:hypothetical protein n=1 Tax=uncultured Tateyamaria sp. TaxID=455651 RepID=UPI0026319006|nr:hypothetical protein [uncultured Tateyamaria sp.]
MTSPQERALLYELAKSYFTGKGVIIDAGVFLGASSAAFGEGALENTNLPDSAEAFIHSYDIAVWLDEFKKYLLSDPASQVILGHDLQPGGSFEEPLKEVLKKYESLQRFIIGDIVALAPNHQGPIEIAFYDCLKNYERDKAAFLAFTPHYIPGRTIVLQQDYFYESAAYNKIRQEYFMDHFEFLGAVKDTAAFLCTSPLPKMDEKDDPILKLSISEQLSLIEVAAERTADRFRRIKVRLAGLQHAIEQGASDQAVQLASSIGDEIRSTGKAAKHKRICTVFNNCVLAVNEHNSEDQKIEMISLSEEHGLKRFKARLKKFLGRL